MTIEMKKTHIKQKTIAYLMKMGWRNASMDDIASYAQVSKVTIYKHFIDKDSFFYEIIKSIYLEETNALDLILSSDEELAMKLYRFFDCIAHFTLSGNYDLCEDMATFSSEIHDLKKLYQMSYEKILSSFIDTGLQNNLFKEDLEFDIVFHYIQMGIHYFQHNLAYREKMTQDQSFQNQFMSFLFGNLFRESQKIAPFI